MSKITRLTGGLLVALVVSTLSSAAERPTLNFHTADPRPDILPHPFYNAYNGYRRVYNRPTFAGGWIASQIAPSSLEAMVWYENLQVGNYNEHHLPPMCKRYYYPKPWEVLATGPRPDFATQKNAGPVQETSEFDLKEVGPAQRPAPSGSGAAYGR